MGWFDDQIRLRKENDDIALSEAFMNIGDAVLGKSVNMENVAQEKVAGSAIEQILLFYHIKHVKIPENLKNVDDQIDYVMQPKGIMRRMVKLVPGWRKDAIGPMLGVRTDNQTTVAILPGLKGDYYYYDYVTETRIKITKQNENLIGREAYVFYKPFPQRKMNIADFVKFMIASTSAGDRARVVTGYALVALIGLLIPKIHNVLFSSVIDSGSIRVLLSLAVFMISVEIATALINVFQQMIENGITTKTDVAIESAVMMRILSLPTSFFKNYSAGELSSYTAQMNSLSSLIISSFVNGGFTSLFSLIYIGQVFKYAPTLVLPSVIITLSTCLFSILLTVFQTNQSRKIIKCEAKESGLSYALISGIQKIRLTGAEKRAFAKWGREYAITANLNYNPPKIIKYSAIFTTMITLIGNILLYFLAVESNVSVADYYSFTSAYGMVSAAFTGLASLTLSIASIRPVIESVKPIMETEPEISSNKEYVSSLAGSIELSHVSFRYNERGKNIIDDLSLKIRPGQYVAIVGKTGCGKSTLVRLLLGFEKPQMGSIFYDGKEMDSLDLKSLRRKIGVVLQDGKLFQGDLFSNIVITAPTLTLDDAWEAAELAGIADDIRDLPMGMNTLIAEGSGGFSGGQKQRLMIARAVAPKPKILIMDEATAALDNITQKHVSESLDRLKCTRIVIAHRLSTIRQCERILVFDGGHIIEDGTYDELIAKKGFFAELVDRQRLDKES